MQFPDSFFEDEIRDGFYVPAIMKQAWAAELEVLADVAKVCEKHHIRWFAEWGTLLGAVRHGGFIPWDDDLDICMLRDDYIRFNQIAQQELPPGYYIPRELPDNYHLHTMVWNTDHIRMDEGHLEKFHGFPFIAGLDIYARDYIAPDPGDEEFRKQLALIVYTAAVMSADASAPAEEMERLAGQIEELLQVQLDKTKPLKRQLFSLAEQLFSLYTPEAEAGTATEVALMHRWILNQPYKHPLAYFQKPVYLPFEGMEIPVPSGYDEILKVEYGNYMEYCRSGDAHSYPFFGPMLKKLAAIAGEEGLPFEYRFSADDLKRAGRKAAPSMTSRAGRREVVFLPWKASLWPGLEPYWRQAQADPDCDAYVIPVPYYYRKPNGEPGTMHYEGDLFPEEVPVTDYNSYDFQKRHPDVIFIHNPYDEYNPASTLHPFFYARNLKPYTDRLVYTPFFVTDEITPEDRKSYYNMRYYASMPGVILADTVIVLSEQTRLSYIRFLSETYGEDTQTIWEEKITCNSRIPFLKTR